MRKRTDQYSLRHLHQRASTDADQVEIVALKEGGAIPEDGIRDDRIAGAMDDYGFSGGGAAPEWQLRDLEDESAVDIVWRELMRRTQILGDAYPFTVKSGKISYTPSDNLVYEFCLAVCMSPNITTGDYKVLPRIFERLTTQLSKDYLGENSEALHTGSPRPGRTGFTFKQAMQTLSEKSGEWFWGPDDDLPPEGPGGTGDQGVDFVAWKKAPDGRKIGQLYLLGQCACGNDWEEKLTDLSADYSRIKMWFNPISYVFPVRVFAVPYHLTDAKLIDSSRRAGLIFDRARFVALAYSVGERSSIKPLRRLLKCGIDIAVGK